MKRITITLSIIIAIFLISGMAIQKLANDRLKDQKNGTQKTSVSTQEQNLIRVANVRTFLESVPSPNGRRSLYADRGDYDESMRYYELYVWDTADRSRKRIFSGDPRTLGWNWITDNTIEVSYNCGTGCIAKKTLDIDSYERIADYGDGEMNEENGWQTYYYGTTGEEYSSFGE